MKSFINNGPCRLSVNGIDLGVASFTEPSPRKRQYVKHHGRNGMPLCNQDGKRTGRWGDLDWELIALTYGFGEAYPESRCTGDVSQVTCRRCLRSLARCAGLSKDAPAGVIHDKLVEEGVDL